MKNRRARLAAALTVAATFLAISAPAIAHTPTGDDGRTTMADNGVAFAISGGRMAMAGNGMVCTTSDGRMAMAGGGMAGTMNGAQMAPMTSMTGSAQMMSSGSMAGS